MNSTVFDLNDFFRSGVLWTIASNVDSPIWVAIGPFSAASDTCPDLLCVSAPDFFVDRPLALQSGRATFKFTKSEFLKILKQMPSTPPSLKFEAPTYDLFKSDFDILKRQIQSGILQKAVPCVFEKSNQSLSNEHLCFMLISLLSETKNSLHASRWIYGFWENGSGIMGLTPESLFEIKGPLLHTMALAGSAKSAASDEEFKSNPKERIEHQIVIRQIQESLSNLGNLKILETKVLNLPQIKHLKTSMVLTPNAVRQFSDWVQALHPTPALGGYPKKQALEYLKSLSSAKIRRRFGAPFYISTPESDSICLVGIRNIQWDNSDSDPNRHQILIGSGCGIVKDSQLDSEWKELELKRNSVKSFLGIL